MEDIVILDLQNQVRRLSSQILQVKKAMREPPCIEGSLDPNHYLKWIQVLECYFKAGGCLDEESFVIATKKL